MKKEYRKPQIVKVSLKTEQTVLGRCKFEGASEEGPGAFGCIPVPGGNPCVGES